MDSMEQSRRHLPPQRRTVGVFPGTPETPSFRALPQAAIPFLRTPNSEEFEGHLGNQTSGVAGFQSEPGAFVLSVL